MAGRPRKITQQEDIPMESPITTITPVSTDPTPEIVSVNDSIKERRLFRVSEVAVMFDVTERCVYLWLENGHLQTELTPGGQHRITKESIDGCRFKKRPDNNNSDEE